MKRNTLELLAGPCLFLLIYFTAQETFGREGAGAVGLAVWMALWWTTRPVSISVTALLPVVINAMFSLIPSAHVISQYFSEVSVLLLGSDLICQTWTLTGLDRRISVKALLFIGPSMKQQIAVWLLASVTLSIFLPNVVVAAIFCPIAVAMLKACGETDISKSPAAAPILLAIGWGSGIGGFGSPIGSAANLVAISYVEQLLGHEFMYVDWVVRFMPLLLLVALVNLAFLWHMPCSVKKLHGTKPYFKRLYDEFGPMRREEWMGLAAFSAATVLAFSRPLWSQLLPEMKPAYVFMALGLLMFMLRDENGKPVLTWKYAESHSMWGMIMLFASGMALGKMLMETGAVDQMAQLLAATQVSNEFAVMILFCFFGVCFSEISSNTAAVSITLPLVLSMCKAVGLSPVPYIIAATACVSCAYILPISTRAIPIGYGLDAGVQIKYGLRLSLLSFACTTCFCYLLMKVLPMYSNF